MPEHPLSPLSSPLDRALDQALTAVGFSRGAVAPARSLYLADVAAAQEVLLSVGDDALILRTFLAPVPAVGYEQVSAARAVHDGYVVDEFDGGWVLTERISDYLTAEFPDWNDDVSHDDAAPTKLIAEVVDLLVARTVAIGRYGAAVARQLSALRAFIGSPELTSH